MEGKISPAAGSGGRASARKERRKIELKDLDVCAMADAAVLAAQIGGTRLGSKYLGAVGAGQWRPEIPSNPNLMRMRFRGRASSQTSRGRRGSAVSG